MRDDYRAARRLGEEAVREAKRTGKPVGLPVLEEIPGYSHTLSEVRLGLIELPVSRIVGNKEAGRSSAFANNFMPLLEDGSEFAIKWSNLYDSFLDEGIRDAIKVYEYMNNYYVQEGNKRVSVARFGEMEFILADVRRVMPKPDDSKEYKVYSEYLDFYSCTKNVHIVFSEPGEYAKLADLLGQTLDETWPESVCSDLKLAFFSFCRKCRSILKLSEVRELSEAFLLYISIFPMKTLFRDTEEQIIKNIKLAYDEISSAGADNIAFLESAPDGSSQKTSRIRKLLSGKKKYSAAAPLRAAFIYDKDPEESRWTDSHEAGRLYVEQMTDKNVVTKSYIGSDEETIDRAIAEGNEIIFAVSPSMIPAALKSAVKNPQAKIICCSVGEKHTSLRYYHGKLYEANFLMGLLAADRLLLEQSGAPRRIGYLVRSRENFSRRDLNAFAVGVSLIDPEAAVVLSFADKGDDVCREEWVAQGVKYYADFDYQSETDVLNRLGLFRMGEGDEKDTYIGAPYFSWGKYYVQIVQSVLSGAWDMGEEIGRNTSASYWFGLSTGVVDIRAADLDYRTGKMIAFFKNSIVNGGFDPFTGELRTAEGKVYQAETGRRVGVSLERQTLRTGDIAFMDWLNENIEGDIP